jgi:hypothetical protein
MRVFVYEYVCGGGLAGRPLPESLAGEGWAMLASVVEDFAQVAECQVTATLDERLCGRAIAAHSVVSLAAGEEQPVIERLAAECDWTLVIGPEFDGILLDRVRWVEAAGGRLLGPSSAAVASTADKFACGQLLKAAGVPTVVGQVVRPAEVDFQHWSLGFPAVLKPRDGAGSQATFMIRDRAGAASVLREAIAMRPDGEMLLQPFVPGVPASVSFLIGPAAVVPLAPAQQRLSHDGRFRYLGGRVPLAPPLAARAVALASRAVRAVTGLCGYVGVDLVLGVGDRRPAIGDQPARHIDRALPVADNREPTAEIPCLASAHGTDTVVEINPRLTTSYVGLRKLAKDNLAARMIDAVAGRTVPALAWRDATIRFAADGRLT